MILVLGGRFERIAAEVSNDGYGSHFNEDTITLCPHAVNVFIGYTDSVRGLLEACTE